jgi:phosphatidylserine/phosphatidylglycerophosphate/cardiolipin synthase-like enzyme
MRLGAAVGLLCIIFGVYLFAHKTTARNLRAPASHRFVHESLLFAERDSHGIREVRYVVGDAKTPLIRKLQNGDSIHRQIRRLIHSADRSIDICSPEVFIRSNERECLKKWVMEKPGRTIRVLSSSQATSDGALPLASLMPFERESASELLSEGPYRCVDPLTHKISEGVFNNLDSKIQVFNHGDLRAKFGVIDGKLSFIGSHYFDQHSRRLSSDTAFVIENSKIASDMTRYFESLIRISSRVSDPE